MEKQPLVVSSLSIQKMPGLPGGLSTYRNLSPSINLIIGPNGAGKTSTTRAIHSLIWGRTLRGLEGEMTMKIGPDTWKVRADGGKIASQRGGVDASVTGLPAAEGADRYTLALHDLVIEKGKDLAGEIRRQAAGGYDIEAAARTLNYYYGPQRRSAGPYLTWSQASQAYGQKKREQEEVKAEEARLAPLRTAKQEGEIARDQVNWYDKTVAWLEAKRRHEQAVAHLAMFPDTLAIMTGEEYTKIAELTEEIAVVALAIQTAEHEMEIQQNVIEVLNLPDTGVAPTVLTELETLVKALEDLERDLRDREKKAESARGKEQAALQQLGQGKDPSGWAGLPAQNLALVDDQLWRHHQTLSEQQAVEEVIEAWNKEAGEQGGPPMERLNAGVDLLSKWLGTEGSRSVPNWIPWVLALLGIGTAFAVVLVGTLGLIGMIFIVGAFLLSLRKPTDGKDRWEREYINLGLPTSGQWDRPGVIQTAAMLLEAIKERTWQKKVGTMLEFHKGVLQKLQPKLEAFRLERARLEEILTFLPSAPTTGDLKNYSAIYLFLRQVSDWASANRDYAEAIGERDSIEASIVAKLARFNGITISYALTSSADGASARGNYVHLRNLDKAWQDAQKAIGNAQSVRLDRIGRKMLLEGRRTAIFTSIGLEQEELETVRGLKAKLPEFGRAQQERTESTAVLLDRRGELESHSLFAERGEELERLQLDDVIQRRHELWTRAGRLEQVNAEINQIEGKISMLKQGRDLEAALASKNKALDGLAELYHANLGAITGQLIVDGLKQEIGDENQPAVYRRAKVLFSRITRGRYELIPPSVGSDDGFRAKDTVRDWGQPLEELSTATRIQLLLAVRLAFIEEQEQQLRLPLLADELLATTDDQRAEAIIEALTVISEEGRQLFYFTAQRDEVIKWQQYLEGKPYLQVGFWELDGSSNEVSRRTPEPSSQPAITFAIRQPKPDGLSHSEYGAALQAEPFDLLNSSVRGLHLWYLIEDTQLLHHWLSKGINRWGQLADFIASGGVLLGWTAEMTTNAHGKIDLLERYQQLHRQGRARRIDREVLDLSKTITDRFMEAVVEKLREVNGNPRELVAALRNREVPTFRVAVADDLEKYLLENGFIDELEILAQDDIFLRLQAFLSGTGLPTIDAEQFVNRILTDVSNKNTTPTS